MIGRSSMQTRTLKRVGMAMVVLVAAVAAWDLGTYDPGPWRADYRQLKREVEPVVMAAIGLERTSKASVMELDRQTRTSIDEARSRIQTYLALRRFQRAFAADAFDLGPY